MSASIIHEQINLLKGESKLNKKHTSNSFEVNSPDDEYEFLSKGKL